jgi:hypothetical protein
VLRAAWWTILGLAAIIVSMVVVFAQPVVLAGAIGLALRWRRRHRCV